MSIIPLVLHFFLLAFLAMASIYLLRLFYPSKVRFTGDAESAFNIGVGYSLAFHGVMISLAFSGLFTDTQSDSPLKLVLVPSLILASSIYLYACSRIRPQTLQIKSVFILLCGGITLHFAAMVSATLAMLLF